MSIESEFLLSLPDDFDDYAWEVQAKGVFWDACLTYSGQEYALIFYEPHRLSQDVAEQLTAGTVYFEVNLLVIEEVTREAMVRAVSELVHDGRVRLLLPKP